MGGAIVFIYMHYNAMNILFFILLTFALCFPQWSAETVPVIPRPAERTQDDECSLSYQRNEAAVSTMKNVWAFSLSTVCISEPHVTRRDDGISSASRGDGSWRSQMLSASQCFNASDKNTHFSLYLS